MLYHFCYHYDQSQYISEQCICLSIYIQSLPIKPFKYNHLNKKQRPCYRLVFTHLPQARKAPSCQTVYMYQPLHTTVHCLSKLIIFSEIYSRNWLQAVLAIIIEFGNPFLYIWVWILFVCWQCLYVLTKTKPLLPKKLFFIQLFLVWFFLSLIPSNSSIFVWNCLFNSCFVI